MKSRLAVAAVGIPLVLIAILANWLHGALFVALITFGTAAAALELLQMLRPTRPFVPAALVAVVIAPLLAWGANEPGVFAAMLVALPLTMTMARISAPRLE